METPTPTVRTFVTVDGTKYELVDFDKMTWPETKVAKQVSGMNLAQMEQGCLGMDPDAWFAWVLVSIRRQQPRLTERDLEQMIGDTPLVAIVETVEREEPEVSHPDVPPDLSPDTSSTSTPLSSNGSGESTLPPSMPVISGSQD